MAIPKMWRIPIFEKHFFRPKMPEICRKSRVWHFLEISSFAISDFLHRWLQRCVLAMPKTWIESDFWEKFFSRTKMPEIAVFADFHWIFALKYVVFSHKNNTYYPARFNFNKTDFWSRKFLKIIEEEEEKNDELHFWYRNTSNLYWFQIFNCFFPHLFCVKSYSLLKVVIWGGKNSEK